MEECAPPLTEMALSDSQSLFPQFFIIGGHNSCLRRR
jgi:hypothetical protein